MCVYIYIYMYVWHIQPSIYSFLSSFKDNTCPPEYAKMNEDFGSYSNKVVAREATMPSNCTLLACFLRKRKKTFTQKYQMEIKNNEKPPKTNTRTTVSSSSASNNSSKISTNKNKDAMDQYNADARLLAEFEDSSRSGKFFDYTKSVKHAKRAVPEEQITAYLSRMQRGGLIQPHGCLIVIEEGTFKIICYSENCRDFLGLSNICESSSGLIGFDARQLFSPSSAKSLIKAVESAELSLVNPIWVHSRSTQKPFYAILHRLDVGNVIDLEPADSSDPSLLVAGAVQSQKIAVRAISELQSLPAGDIRLLCNTVAEEVRKLTEYDRVMVYKFHEDQHGEVVSEIKRPDLEPYLELHFPATDVPQAARFLFEKNQVRMICDCLKKPVRIVQSDKIKQPLCLNNSTLRAPHDCHYAYMANMGSIASLVSAVTVNENGSTKLWGLVVCHHTSPRYVPYPLRYACGFLMQAFGIQLRMEIQLASQLEEKKFLRMQTMLCDFLLRDVPYGVVTQSPTIMDLVKCDGAALFYKGRCWLLGVTPTEAQVKDLSEWLLKNHGDSTGLSTDCLTDTGYPGAASLGDAICGVVAARISERDFLFWFRSHSAKEIKWGGLINPYENTDGDEKMNPKTSFRAFLEVVRGRSLPWEISEISVVHTLQVIMRDKLLETEGCADVANDSQGNYFDVELSSVASEMVKLIETASAPIFGVDSDGLINGWNSKIAEMTGLQDSEAMGKSLLNEIVSDGSRETVEDNVGKALQGEENLNVELKLKKFNIERKDSDLYVLASACPSRDCWGHVVGVCFVGQDITCEKYVRDKFIRLQGDYEALVHGLNPLIPPIFASNEDATCSEWNKAMEKLSGWARDDVIGKLLPGDIFGGLCRLESRDVLTKFLILLYNVFDGKVGESFPFGFFDREGKYVEVLLMAHERTDESGKIIGCFCFVQIASGSKEHLRGAVSRESELSYIRQEIKRPLDGLRFIRQLLENTIVAENQQQLFKTSDACERQMIMVLDDMDLGCIEEGRIELNSEEFLLVHVIDAVVAQVMVPFKEKKVQLVHEIPNEIKQLSVFGDQVKLQLVLSEFLLYIAHHAPSHGWVEIKVSSALKIIHDGDNLVQLQFRMTHPGKGFPCGLVQDMFREGNKRCNTHEGLGLNMSRKLLNFMNGNVEYMRETDICYFLIDLILRKSEFSSE